MFDASFALHLTKRNAAVDADVLFDVDIDSIDLESEQDLLRLEREVPTSFELDLSDPRYKEDFNPISSNCGCYTCLNHTRDIELIGGISVGYQRYTVKKIPPLIYPVYPLFPVLMGSIFERCKCKNNGDTAPSVTSPIGVID